MRQGLRARVITADGTEVGRLEAVGSGSGSLRVVDADGLPQARLTPVWDIPGTRHHLPPGVVLADRRGPEAAPERRLLLLGALLAAPLLLPPDEPRPD